MAPRGELASSGPEPTFPAAPAHGLSFSTQLLPSHLRKLFPRLPSREEHSMSSSVRAPATKVSSVVRPIAFLFPGQGVQRVNMGRDLYRDEPVFRAAIDRSAEILHAFLGLDLRAVLYPEETAVPEEAERLLARTDLAQPALVAFELALARLWESWGVVPRTMIGHSVGEYAAACLAGVFSLEDTLLLVAERGRRMEELGTGAM